MLLGETSLVKPASLYEYNNAMLIQRINFLDMYVCSVLKRVDLCKNMLSGETSLVKAEYLYAYHNAMLIQRINFLDMYVCMYVYN